MEKGITLVGTGDFTHPGWMKEIESQLVPAEEGFFRLRDDLAHTSKEGVPNGCTGEVRFVLQVEISNIYKKDDRTRKNHNLVFVPTIEAAKTFSEKLGAIGNINSDGRPILGLDARDLLEITLETDPSAFLVPAHIWTPWFSALGSKSGFDSIAECFDDLSDEIFAVETGLSSDPPMNWRLPELDRMTIISNSDAHSAQKLGREANLLDTDLNYPALLHALRTGQGFEGTLEFFPEEGKYHMDGHRKCGLRLTPEQTREYGGRCPTCGGKLTVGVMSRVMDLAAPDRPEGYTPENRKPFESLVPLSEVIGEVLDVGSGSKRVAMVVHRMLSELGPELFILKDAPLEEIEKVAGTPCKEAISRIRKGDMAIDAGYDGEFGKVKVFTPEERASLLGQTGFFGLAGFGSTKTASTKKKRAPSPQTVAHPSTKATQKSDSPPKLNPAQQQVVDTKNGPMVVVAGPGTGKTRTLVTRIAHQIESGQVSPHEILAITFTNQATLELQERLDSLCSVESDTKNRPMVCTFHGFGRFVLETFGNGAPTLIEPDAQEALMAEAIGETPSKQEIQSAMNQISLAKQSPNPLEQLKDNTVAAIFDRYEGLLNRSEQIDVDDLVLKAYTLLQNNPNACNTLNQRFSSISIDEYQDINNVQAALIRCIAQDGKGLLVIGDPDQAIYGFRGAEPGHFIRFKESYPGATEVTLDTTYRLTQPVLKTAHFSLGEPRVLSTTKTGPKVEVMACPTPESEGEQLLIKLEQLVGGSSHFAVNSGRGGYDDNGDIGFGDIAVLTRIKKQREAILTALERSAIPCMRVGESDPHDPRSQKVAVMTMHASKGREFEIVFVTGVEAGLLPLDLPGLTSDPDEERRLLFVAITRAKQRAYLSYAKKRTLFGKTMPAGPSPFIIGLPGDIATIVTPSFKQKSEKQQLSLF